MNMRGHKAHLRRLKAMGGDAMEREVGAAIYAAAERHAIEAALSITAGSVSGKGHVASRPGESPNSDSHKLDRSIHAERDASTRLRAKSIADAPYAVALEVGTSKMAARPYMRPAAKKVKKEATALVEKAFSRAIRKPK